MSQFFSLSRNSSGRSCSLARNKLGTGPFSKESEIGHIGMLAARMLKCTCSPSGVKTVHILSGCSEISEILDISISHGYLTAFFFFFWSVPVLLPLWEESKLQRNRRCTLLALRYCFQDFDLQTAEYTRALENFWCPLCRFRCSVMGTDGKWPGHGSFDGLLHPYGYLSRTSLH